MKADFFVFVISLRGINAAQLTRKKLKVEVKLEKLMEETNAEDEKQTDDNSADQFKSNNSSLSSPFSETVQMKNFSVNLGSLPMNLRFKNLKFD